MKLLLILLIGNLLTCSSEEIKQASDKASPVIDVTSCSFDLLDGECTRYKDDSYLCSMGKCSLGDCITGKGAIAYPNGTTLETSFKKGKMDGLQSLKECSNGLLFLGILDAKSSKGKHTYPNGEVFEGSIIEGKKQGKGTFTDSTGNIIEGSWKDDIKEGKFTIIDFDSKTKRVVTYINGKDDEQRERERLNAIEIERRRDEKKRKEEAELAEMRRKEQGELAQALRWQNIVHSCNVFSSGNYNHCDLRVPTIYKYSNTTAYYTTCNGRKNLKVEDVFFNCQLKGQKPGTFSNDFSRIWFDENGNCSTDISDLCDR